jgi:hypothetical protein
MRVRLATLVVGGLLAGILSGAAFAQQQQQSVPSKSEMEQLNQLSQQRLTDHPLHPGPPVPQSSIPPTQAIPLTGLWVCRSFDQFSSIHASPSASSPVIARTMAWGAVTGGYVNGFQKVLLHRGDTGWVAKDHVHPFHDKVDPSATCQVLGTQPNGLALISIK